MPEPIIDFELAEDTQELFAKNDDVKCENSKVEEQLRGFNSGVLLKVTKSIGSFTIIHGVEEVTEKVIEKL